MDERKKTRKYKEYLADHFDKDESMDNLEQTNAKRKKLDNNKDNTKIKTYTNLNQIIEDPLINTTSKKKPSNPFVITVDNITEKATSKNSIDGLELNNSDLDLIFEDHIESDYNNTNSIENLERPKISNIYYINGNKLTIKDLKDGRRIFNNKTEFMEFSGFKENFIEFRQLLFENLLLNEDLTDNLKEKWTMESAIFSTFCYDAEFIEPLIKKFKIKSLIIKEGSGNNIEEIDEDITFIHPKLDFTMKWGKFHSKLTIFKFPEFIRVIIPSANLTNGDWYYWGQIIWFQDFYLKKEKIEKIKNSHKMENHCINDKNLNYTQNSNNLDNSCDFEVYLQKFIDSILPNNYKTTKWYQKLNLNLSEYDFSHTCVDLIASASGRFKNERKFDFGIGRLKYLTKTYTQQRKSLNNSLNRLIIQCSSIGKSLKEKFLSDFCESFLCRKKEESYKIEIIYPTIEYVDSFQHGRDLSSCLFLNKETFLMHKYKFKKFEVISELENCKTIFHSKFFICGDHNQIHPNGISDNTIFYFGSHNFSVAAWGNFEKNDSQVSIANYELGILFNPIKLRFEEKQNIVKSLLVNLNSSFYSNLDEAWVFDDK